MQMILRLLAALAFASGVGTVQAEPVHHLYKLFEFYGSRSSLNGSIEITSKQGEGPMDPFTTYQYVMNDITGWEFNSPGTAFHITGTSVSAYKAPFEARWEYIYERGGYGWYLYFDFDGVGAGIDKGEHTTFGVELPSGGGVSDHGFVAFRKGGGVCPLGVCTAGGGLTWADSLLSVGDNKQIEGSVPIAKLVVIPIPSTLPLIGLGLALLGYGRRSRKIQG